MRGTHQGNVAGLLATGRPVHVRGVTIVEFADGKIRRNSDYWDRATVLRQLGLMPSG